MDCPGCGTQTTMDICRGCGEDIDELFKEQAESEELDDGSGIYLSDFYKDRDEYGRK